jgi:hypothetical protein
LRCGELSKGGKGGSRRDPISSFGEKLKENAERDGALHEEQLEEILKEFKDNK